MNDPRYRWKFERRFASDHRTACDLTEEILAQLVRFGWSESDRFAVQLGLEEGLMNAIKHGNRGDSKKSVTLLVELESDEIFIRIVDEGTGFAAGQVPDPTHKANRRRDSGRGVALIRGFMDSVQYNEPGNQLEMRKRKTQEANC